MSIQEQTDRHIAVYPYNEMLLSNKKEQITDTHNRDESQKY